MKISIVKDSFTKCADCNNLADFRLDMKNIAFNLCREHAQELAELLGGAVKSKEQTVDLSSVEPSAIYLCGMYKLKPIDMVVLNKGKLCQIYNCSDIDALNYMSLFCKGEWEVLCNRLIHLNEQGAFNAKEYLDGKEKLLDHFGIKLAFGDAVIGK